MESQTECSAFVEAFLQGDDRLSQIEKGLAGFASLFVKEMDDARLVDNKEGLIALSIGNHAERRNKLGGELLVIYSGKVLGFCSAEGEEQGEGRKGEARCHGGKKSG